ncbi:MAG TPA: hypothetical protein VJ201_04395 [Candidatus Babeliales bacterium]|nr:hypothetical protein [Candidatus Babeliales bacterium]HLC07254.1 hypothetical protein [Candidatus Babeliales bacterium]
MNNSYNVIFLINNQAKIVIPLQDPVEWLGPIYQENIVLLSNNHKVSLSKKTIYHDMLDLVELLNQSLNNKLRLDQSINQDIGYLVHEYHIDETKVTQYTFPSGVISWVGYKYKLWEAHEDNLCLMSWIYNKPDGSIIFEVTPFYPYMYCEPEEEPNYIPYEEWIKTYKPYLIAMLSKEKALQWLEQAQHIIRIIEENEAKWQAEKK